MKKVLVCGHKSFVASGMTKTFDKVGITYDCFSRGENNREAYVVTGDVMDMNHNAFLDTYDTVINFIIIKDGGVEENLRYIKSLLKFCKEKKVKNLIQISSISVYPNEARYVNEESEIEKDYRNKGGYASIKVAVDHYLEEHVPSGLVVSYVRPGYIYTKDKKASKVGILVTKLGFNILLGDKLTTLPLVCRETLHKGLVKLVLIDNKPKVCLFLNKNENEGKKYNFVRDEWNVKPWCLPAWLLLPIAKILKAIGIFKQRHYLKVVGLFKRTWFDSSNTERALGISFKKKEIAVLGAGTYGSYTSDLLARVYPHENITLIDVGDSHLKTESEIGYISRVVNAPYEGLQKARFFGYGGASAKWGGQLLTFTENDFVNPTEFMRGIVALNIKYKDRVLAKFGLENKTQEVRLEQNLFTKTGIWLSYFHRNLFIHFRIAKNKKIKLLSNSRVIKLLNEGKLITGIELIQHGQHKMLSFDQYFLTSGAFESSRLLVESGLSKQKGKMTFSDHLSQRAFKVKSGPQMGDQDFTFHVQGASLVTKRFVGEIDGYSFYSQPICNEDFPFFRDLKKLLFGHKFRAGLLMNIIKNIPSCIAFAWNMIILKKMYIYKNEFYLQIDIEAPRESGKMSLNNEKDAFGERSVDVDLTIMPQTGELFTKARACVKSYLDKNGVVYEELPFSTSAEKYEDVYHPFGMFCDFNSVEDYFQCFENMLVVNTGVLPRAGGINSTCAVLPLVEEYVNNVME